MKIIRIDQNNPDPEMIQLAVDILNQGGIVCHPTDTCYGLAADIHNSSAVKKLYDLKRMSLEKPTSIMVSDELMFASYGILTPSARILIDEYWPGALTIVTAKGSNMPIDYNPGNETVGVRLPRCRLSISLVRRLGRAVTTTSANISGQPSTYSVLDLWQQFSAQAIKPDLVLDAGELDRQKLPSTIVEVLPDNWKVLRQGSVCLEKQLVA